MELAGKPVEAERERRGIHRFDHGEQVDRPPRLVRLEGPQQVPAGTGDLAGLVERLLDPVLAEDVEAGRDGRAKALRGDRLGDRDQGDFRAWAARTPGCVLDPFQHLRPGNRERSRFRRIEQERARVCGTILVIGFHEPAPERVSRRRAKTAPSTGA